MCAVIGMAQDLDPKNLAVFCGSIRNVSNADVVIFMNAPVSPKSLEIAQRYSVIIKPFALQDLDHKIHPFHPSTLRWSLIYEFFTPQDIRQR
jgi:hypothetical protein